jgi:hypothetical protein
MLGLVTANELGLLLPNITPDVAARLANGSMVLTMSCDWPFEAVAGFIEDSLFEVLHGVEAHEDSVVQYVDNLVGTENCASFIHQVVTAIQRVIHVESARTQFENLSSHEIIIRGELPPLLVMSKMGHGAPDDLCRWRAPDVLRGSTSAGSESALVYTLGMIMMEVLRRQIPLDEMSADEIEDNALLHLEPPTIAEEGPLWDIVRACVTSPVVLRPSLAELKRMLRALMSDGTGLMGSALEIGSADDVTEAVEVVLADENLEMTSSGESELETTKGLQTPNPTEPETALNEDPASRIVTPAPDVDFLSYGSGVVEPSDLPGNETVAEKIETGQKGARQAESVQEVSLEDIDPQTPAFGNRRKPRGNLS